MPEAHDHDHAEVGGHAPSHSHGHAHAHGVAAARAGARHQRPLAIAFGLTLAFLVVQIVTGIATRSLAILSDAGHMATDALGMGLGLAAIRVASRQDQRSTRTFGLYRLEILAALTNAVLLVAVAVYVLIEAADRLRHAPHIASVPVLIVGVVGLVVNTVSFLILREGSKESLNVQGAYVEVLSDMLGSFGVILAATIMGITGWRWVDPVIGAAIGLFILPRAFSLGRQALRVLLQEAPPSADLEGITTDLAAIDGVVDVHDLHLWTLTSEMDVLTAHLMTGGGADAHAVLDQARAMLADRHGIGHATLQVEPDTHHGCDEVSW